MAKFHSYSFNNTLLIAMQGGQLVAGYNKWRDDFHRNVKRGEKGIKILAPAPYKVKKEVPKLDEQGKPVMDKDGKPLTEVQETQVPAFKIVSVFDVSQTEGEPLALYRCGRAGRKCGAIRGLLQGAGTDFPRADGL